MPKVELHVHLEGAVRPARLLAIFRRHGLHAQFPDLRSLEPLFHHESFAEFLDHFRFVVTSLRTVEDVHDVALDLFEDLVSQNVVYAEVLFSAAIFVRMGMPWKELFAAVDEAAAHVESRAPGGTRRFHLVVDLVRNFGADFAREQVRELARLAPPRVVGVHLGGDEVAFPARWFEAAYADARGAGLGCAAHAGEAAGAESVWEALRVLQVSRLGHGIRCLEDPGLVEELQDRQTTLEVCPTSNVRTRVVDELASHPLPELRERGLAVCLGADDPSFFDTDLTREMLAVHRELRVDVPALEAMTEQAMQAAFCSAPRRRQGLERIQGQRRALWQELGLRFPESRS
jgi:adenosine deaminase